MAERKAMTFQEALDAGKINENDYFLVRYPGGNDKLFRLVKQENGYVMWGPPTEKEVTFAGKEGYDNLFKLADNAVKAEYNFPEMFESIHACGLPEKEYEICTYEDFCRVENKVKEIYKYPDDAWMAYALASRCTEIRDGYTDFILFYVSGNNVDVNWLFDTYGNDYSSSHAVRPEAIPKPTMCLKLEDRNGSKENPWICICSQSDMQKI